MFNTFFLSSWLRGVGWSGLSGGEVRCCFVGSLPVVQLLLCGRSPLVLLFSGGTKENGVINYLVSAGLRGESALDQ